MHIDWKQKIKLSEADHLEMGIQTSFYPPLWPDSLWTFRHFSLFLGEWSLLIVWTQHQIIYHRGTFLILINILTTAQNVCLKYDWHVKPHNQTRSAFYLPLRAEWGRGCRRPPAVHVRRVHVARNIGFTFQQACKKRKDHQDFSFQLISSSLDALKTMMHLSKTAVILF